MTQKLTDSELDQLAERTEVDLDRLAGQFDQGETPPVVVRRGRGRPTLGSAPSEPMRLRLEPELRRAVAERAQAEGTNDSEIVRRALRQHLVPASTSLSQARACLKQLKKDLGTIAAKNPDALVETTVLESVLTSTGELIPEGHPIVRALRDKFPLGGLPAKEALILAGQLDAALPVRPTHEQAAKAMPVHERQQAMRQFQGQAYLWAQAVVQQVHRVKDESEPATEHMADGCLLAYALRATLRAGSRCLLLADVEHRSEINDALARFKAVCPQAKDLRDAIEHFDDYLLNLVELPEPYTLAYRRNDSSTKVQLGNLVIDADSAEQAALHLASVVIAGKDHLGLLLDEV